LLCLALGTRPDIVFAVGILSRFTASPRARHAQALNRVFGYLKGTRFDGISYKMRRGSPALTGYMNSDHAGSVLGFKGVQLRVISFCKLAETEAEYIGQFNVAREAVWIRSLLGLRDLTAEP
jgi:hypothetical protein